MVTNSASYMRQYRLSHPDYVKKANQSRNEYRKTHPEKSKQWEQTSVLKLKLEVLSHYSN